MSQPDDWGIRVHRIRPRAVTAAQRWRHLSLILLMGIFGVRGAVADPSALDVTVAALQGEVHVTSQARPLEVHKGDVVPLPATIDTGPSGSIELRQGNTTLSAAPNSELVIPAPAIPGEAIDRVIQSRGNAFYNVAKRGTSKLHVESAYLVAVIKGTQFSVVAQDDSATISLFEGRLEVRATDGSDVVDLHAGEIAVRHANDSAIRMLRMTTGEPMAHRALPGPAAPTYGQGLPSAGTSNPATAGGEAGDLREAAADVGAESSEHGTHGVNSGGSTSLGAGAGTTLGSGSSSVGDIVAANLENKSANGNSGGNGHNGANDGNGQSTSNNGNGQGGAGNNGNGQGAGNNGNSQTASSNGNGQSAGNNGNGQGAGNNGNGQSGTNNGNGQSAGNNGNGQTASSNGNGQSAGNNGNGQGAGNNGNGQAGSNNGNGQSAGNNGNGQTASNNGNGQSASNNGNGQGAGNNGNGQGSNNGNGHNPAGNNGNGRGGSNKALVRSPSLGTGPEGPTGSGTLNRGITTPLTQTTGANLGIGAPAGGAASGASVGGLLGSVTRHKGSSVQP